MTDFPCFHLADYFWEIDDDDDNDTDELEDEGERRRENPQTDRFLFGLRRQKNLKEKKEIFQCTKETDLP